MNKATKIKDLTNFNGDAALYRVDPPGSQRGIYDHSAALEEAGYSIE